MVGEQGRVRGVGLCPALCCSDARAAATAQEAAKRKEQAPRAANKDVDATLAQFWAESGCTMAGPVNALAAAEAKAREEGKLSLVVHTWEPPPPPPLLRRARSCTRWTSRCRRPSWPACGDDVNSA